MMPLKAHDAISSTKCSAEKIEVKVDISSLQLAFLFSFSKLRSDNPMSFKWSAVGFYELLHSNYRISLNDI